MEYMGHASPKMSGDILFPHFDIFVLHFFCRLGGEIQQKHMFFFFFSGILVKAGEKKPPRDGRMADVLKVPPGSIGSTGRPVYLST